MSIISIVVAVSLVGFLHLASDLDPIERRLSEYATVRYGFVMTVAFLLVGLGIGSLGWAIARSGDVVAGVALVVAGVAMAVSGIFQTDPGAETSAEAIHSTASGLATVLIVGASSWWSFRDRRAGRLSKVLAGAGVVLVIASFFLHESSISGLSQRLLWATLLAWAVAASWPPRHSQHR